MPWPERTRVTILSDEGATFAVYSADEMRAYERAVQGDMGRLGDLLWDLLLGTDDQTRGSIIITKDAEAQEMAA